MQSELLSFVPSSNLLRLLSAFLIQNPSPSPRSHISIASSSSFSKFPSIKPSTLQSHNPTISDAISSSQVPSHFPSITLLAYQII